VKKREYEREGRGGRSEGERKERDRKIPFCHAKISW
jgi:hypothetical protein